LGTLRHTCACTPTGTTSMSLCCMEKLAPRHIRSCSPACVMCRVGQNRIFIHIYTCIRCTYGIFSREITIRTVIYGVYIRFWPTLVMCRVLCTVCRVCMCVCECACMLACVSVCLRICECICIYVHGYASVCIPMSTCTKTHLLVRRAVSPRCGHSQQGRLFGGAAERP